MSKKLSRQKAQKHFELMMDDLAKVRKVRWRWYLLSPSPAIAQECAEWDKVCRGAEQSITEFCAANWLPIPDEIWTEETES